MPTLISLLRGINVGGHKKIKMADLRALFSSLGMRNVRTVLQSGNVLFAADDSNLTSLTSTLEAAIKAQFGFEAQVILRRSADFKRAIASHPFEAPQLQEGGKCAIVFLTAPPDESALRQLLENNPGREIIHPAGDILYIFYSDGMARSKLSNQRIESALDVTASARNWNTCQRIVKLIDQPQTPSSRST